MAGGLLLQMCKVKKIERPTGFNNDLIVKPAAGPTNH